MRPIANSLTFVSFVLSILAAGCAAPSTNTEPALSTAAGAADPQVSLEVAEVTRPEGKWLLSVVIKSNEAKEIQLSKFDLCSVVNRIVFVDETGGLWRFFADPFPLVSPPPHGSDLITFAVGAERPLELRPFGGINLLAMSITGKDRREARTTPGRLWYLLRTHVPRNGNPLDTLTIGGCGATPILWDPAAKGNAEGN